MLIIPEGLRGELFSHILIGEYEKIETVYKNGYGARVTRCYIYGDEEKEIFDLELLNKHRHYIQREITYNQERLPSIDREEVMNVLKQIKEGEIDKKPNIKTQQEWR